MSFSNKILSPQYGDMQKGYNGKVSGLVTNTELVNLTGMSQGTLLDSVDTDIQFHDFAHKGRRLLVPNRPVKHSISWDMIQAVDLVKGKVVTIKGKEYLVRLMTGSRHYYTDNVSIAGGEWEDLFVNFHTSNGGVITDSEVYITGDGNYTWCQEVHSNNLTVRVLRGYGSVSNFANGSSSTSASGRGWRPVLEEL